MATNEMEESEVASGAHSRHPSTSTITSGPLPTDSMVSVRLSDPTVASVLEKTPRAQDYVAPVAHNTLAGHEETLLNPSESISDSQEDAITLEEETKDMARDSVASTTSVFEDEPSMATSGTIRSRSDTSGSFSSDSSAQVDWEELERSEEQAPRDEGSDEVSALATDYKLVVSEVNL